jgi:hypothetical protein
MVEPHDSVAAIVPSLRGQEKTPLEQIKAGAAEHLALEHFQTIDVTLDRAGTPREGHAGFDRVVVVAQPFRKALQGHARVLRRPCQPRIQMVRLSLAHELGEILGSDNGGGPLGMLGFQLGELGGLVFVLPLWAPQDQPGRPAGGEVAG